MRGGAGAHSCLARRARFSASPMIRYALLCAHDDAFEGWFRNSGDYDAQLAAGALVCPLCGSSEVRKAPMAPAVISRRARGTGPEEVPSQKGMLRKLREHVQANYAYVGDGFAEEARAMHEGDAPERAIWGEASTEQAIELIQSGAPIAPLPPGAAPLPPKQLN